MEEVFDTMPPAPAVHPKETASARWYRPDSELRSFPVPGCRRMCDGFAFGLLLDAGAGHGVIELETAEQIVQPGDGTNDGRSISAIFLEHLLAGLQLQDQPQFQREVSLEPVSEGRFWRTASLP